MVDNQQESGKNIQFHSLQLIIFLLIADLTWHELCLQSMWDAGTALDTAGGTGGKHWADAASASLEQAIKP